ncbi:MAG: hypothetical protein EWV81_09130 [Microcystis aeruginosa Ma_SC_T_19800800_S464]|uniref:Uncharacterized protein n=1 Tax=Microcystis aeruginosa Ma_SC_T_19800800_S464 TaxID=2486257 RepID=A0A552DX88_MICAE|nr:MAG: hypothetical protein EWV81_09130 [Microcystis aeruginosa Ma_SC_T_19800800_S464]
MPPNPCPPTSGYPPAPRHRGTPRPPDIGVPPGPPTSGYPPAPRHRGVWAEIFQTRIKSPIIP